MLQLVFTVMLKDLFCTGDDALFLEKKGKQVFSLCVKSARFSEEIRSILQSILYPDEFSSILKYTKEGNGHFVWKKNRRMLTRERQEANRRLIMSKTINTHTHTRICHKMLEWNILYLSKE